MSTSPVRPLTEDEIWTELGAARLGRLATTVAGVIDIFPINFAIDERTIVFRTAPGSKLSEVVTNPQVAFEIDRITDVGAISVVVHGRADWIQRQAEVDQILSSGLSQWVPTVKTEFVRIVPERVSGRAFQFGPEPVEDVY